MATLEGALFTHLSGFAGLSALVSARVYPRRLPQGATLPAVSFADFAGGTEYKHGGSLGKAETYIQIDAWAQTYISAKAVAEQVRLAMLTFTGTIAGYVIDTADRLNVADLIDPERDIHHVAMDFRVKHTEAVA